LEIDAAKVRLKINEKKTKYMIAARNDRTIRDMGQNVAICDKHFEVVKEFVYLGSLVSLEIQRRIQTANFWTAQASVVEPFFKPDKIHHSQDLDPPSPALQQ
jgi:hypothetical protein